MHCDIATPQIPNMVNGNMSDGAHDHVLLRVWLLLFVHTGTESESGSVDEHFQSFLVEQSVSGLYRMRVSTCESVCSYRPGGGGRETGGGVNRKLKRRGMWGGCCVKLAMRQVCTQMTGKSKSINLPRFCKSFSIVDRMKGEEPRIRNMLSHYGFVGQNGKWTPNNTNMLVTDVCSCSNTRCLDFGVFKVVCFIHRQVADKYDPCEKYTYTHDTHHSFDKHFSKHRSGGSHLVSCSTPVQLLVLVTTTDIMKLKFMIWWIQQECY